jgi:hypothetical protein
MTDLVECHSDSGYAEKPVALTWEGRRLDIDLVLAEWRTPEAKYFRVRTSDGQVFELCYTEAAETWRIQQRRGG